MAKSLINLLFLMPDGLIWSPVGSLLYGSQLDKRVSKYLKRSSLTYSQNAYLIAISNMHLIEEEIRCLP